MTKKYGLCGIGNALVDILVEVDEPLFQSFNLEKSSSTGAEREQQMALLGRVAGRSLRRFGGGSVANSVVVFNQIGGDGAFIGSVYDDEWGTFYRNEFEKLGIFLHCPRKELVDISTGTCLVLITPDSERTMQFSLGASAHLSEEFVSTPLIESSEWLLLEGYLLANPEGGRPAVLRAAEVARRCGTKITFTLSESWVVETFRSVVDELLDVTSLLFCNEREAFALTGTSDAKQAFETLRGRIENVVLTQGEKGALYRVNGQEGYIPAFKVDAIDLTGAGDVFAGTFIYGLTVGLDPYTAGVRASYLASKVVSQIGARLEGDLLSEWRSVPRS